VTRPQFQAARGREEKMEGWKWDLAVQTTVSVCGFLHDSKCSRNRWRQRDREREGWKQLEVWVR